MIDPNIKIASTPPGSFYCSDENYKLAKEKIFAKTWQWIGDEIYLKRIITYIQYGYSMVF